MATEISMKALLEAGVHFGHQTRRWHPQMKRYIFTQRNGIHIIDLQQTVALLEKACEFIRQLAADGEDLLFIGTKKQAQEAIEEEAKRCGMPYVKQRWLGGTLTNFATIQGRIDHLVRLEDQKARGEFERLTKKEGLRLDEEIARLNRLLEGIKEMTRIPGALFIIDPVKDRIAVAEAKRVGVPVVGIVDTNCDPDEVDYPIPANDDAIKAIKLLCGTIADAVLEGRASHEGLGELVPAEVAPGEESELVPAEVAPEEEEETSPLRETEEGAS